MIKSEYGDDFRVKDLADNYGSDHQLLKLREECLELVQAIDNHIEKPTAETKKKVVEEEQDVEVLIHQNWYKWAITRAVINTIRSFKYWRQMVRICLGDEKADVEKLLKQKHQSLKMVPICVLRPFEKNLQQYNKWMCSTAEEGNHVA